MVQWHRYGEVGSKGVCPGTQKLQKGVKASAPKEVHQQREVADGFETEGTKFWPGVGGVKCVQNQYDGNVGQGAVSKMH